MAAIALQKATATEVVPKETQAMQETTIATAGEVYKLFSKLKCYHCGKQAIILPNANSRMQNNVIRVRKLDTYYLCARARNLRTSKPERP